MGPQGAPSPAERGREGVKQGAGAGRGGSGGWERRESESGGGGGGDRSERTSCARRRMRRGWGGRCGGRGVVRGGKARWGEARGGERRGLRPTLGNPSVRAPPPPLPGFAAFLPVPTPSLESRATERPPPPSLVLGRGKHELGRARSRRAWDPCQGTGCPPDFHLSAFWLSAGAARTCCASAVHRESQRTFSHSVLTAHFRVVGRFSGGVN